MDVSVPVRGLEVTRLSLVPIPAIPKMGVSVPVRGLEVTRRLWCGSNE